MKRTTNKIPALALGLLLVATCATSAPRVSVQPPVLSGCEFTVDIVVNDEVLDFTGYDLLIDFDEAIMSVVGAEPGPLQLAYAGETFFYWTVAGTVSNALLINGAMLGGSISGPGVLASVTFHGELNGSSPISFAMVDFRDLDNAPIAVTNQGGQATVDDQATVSVTPATSNWPIDQSFTVALELGSGVTFVNSAVIEVLYDDTVLEFEACSEGDLLSTYSPHSAVTFSATGGAGSVLVDAAITDGGSVSGPGSIALLQFKGIFEGDSLIDIDSAGFTRTVIPPIGVCLDDGTVTIEAGVAVEQTHWGMIKSLYR